MFGSHNCTYTVHIVCSHLQLMRSKGPLTETSAFPFENYYSELRGSFQPGTKSPLKQMIQSTILRRKLVHHCCEESIFISAHDSALECNTLIYTYDGSYKFYKILSIHETYVICNPQGRYPSIFPETSDLNWSLIGVFAKGGVSNEKMNIPIIAIKGKVIPVLNYLLTCPINVLREK